MNWKAYDEVHFSDQYILRWVREGDEYVNRITKEMMEDLQAVVSQQEKELSEAGGMIGVLREKICQQQAEIEALKTKTLTPITDEEIKERVKNTINGDWADGYYDGVRWAEEKLRKAQEK